MEIQRSKLNSIELYRNIITVVPFNKTHNIIILEHLAKLLVLKSIMAGQDQYTNFFGFNTAAVLNIKTSIIQCTINGIPTNTAMFHAYIHFTMTMHTRMNHASITQ